MHHYQQRDFEVIDYQCYRLGDVAQPFRGPQPTNLDKGKYFVSIGAAQTFGCFCQKPYTALLQERLGLQSLNLGVGGATPGWFLAQSDLLEYINNSKFVVIQAMTARSVSNSLFTGAKQGGGGKDVVYRDSGVTVSAPEAYQALIDAKDWELLKRVLVETRQNWIDEYKRLFTLIQVPKILFWFSKNRPAPSEEFKPVTQVHQLFKGFPQLVNLEMLTQLRDDCEQYVECVSKRGSPQLLISRFTGQAFNSARQGAKKMQTNSKGEIQAFNDYYPSPEMHEDAAMLLEPACRMI
jgi:Domain of unknown function (DUF6473)